MYIQQNNIQLPLLGNLTLQGLEEAILKAITGEATSAEWGYLAA